MAPAIAERLFPVSALGAPSGRFEGAKQGVAPPPALELSASLRFFARRIRSRMALSALADASEVAAATAKRVGPTRRMPTATAAAASTAATYATGLRGRSSEVRAMHARTRAYSRCRPFSRAAAAVVAVAPRQRRAHATRRSRGPARAVVAGVWATAAPPTRAYRRSGEGPGGLRWPVNGRLRALHALLAAIEAAAAGGGMGGVRLTCAAPPAAGGMLARGCRRASRDRWRQGPGDRLEISVITESGWSVAGSGRPVAGRAVLLGHAGAGRHAFGAWYESHWPHLHRNLAIFSFWCE